MEIAYPEMTREEIIAQFISAKCTRMVEVRDENGKCVGLEKVPCTMGEAIKSQFSSK